MPPSFLPILKIRMSQLADLHVTCCIITSLVSCVWIPANGYKGLKKCCCWNIEMYNLFHYWQSISVQHCQYCTVSHESSSHGSAFSKSAFPLICISMSAFSDYLLTDLTSPLCVQINLCIVTVCKAQLGIYIQSCHFPKQSGFHGSAWLYMHHDQRLKDVTYFFLLTVAYNPVGQNI